MGHRIKAGVFATSMIAAALMPLSAFSDEQQTAGSNVHVTTCSAVKGRAGYTETYSDEGKLRTRHVEQEDSYLKIHYRNTAQAVAREIDFGLVARNELVDKVKDVGTFSPGVLIQHKFKVSREIFPLRTALPYCAVLRVRYDDGRVWTNDNPPNP